MKSLFLRGAVRVRADNGKVSNAVDVLVCSYFSAWWWSGLCTACRLETA